MERTETVLRKSPPSVFFVAYVSDTVLRSRRDMQWDLWTVEPDGKYDSFQK